MPHLTSSLQAMSLSYFSPLVFIKEWAIQSKLLLKCDVDHKSFFFNGIFQNFSKNFYSFIHYYNPNTSEFKFSKHEDMLKKNNNVAKSSMHRNKSLQDFILFQILC